MAPERDSDQTVCFCHNVSFGELTKAIAEGATDLKSIQEKTHASTGCGGCEAEVCEILESQAAEASAIT